VRIAITGASGFIGTALSQDLQRDGHTVVPISRSRGAAGSIHWDPTRGELDAGALAGLDAVVHLAGEGIGEKRWTTEQKARILESRRQGTTLLSDALASLQDKPSVLLSGSAIGIYGDRGDEVLTEASGPGQDFLVHVCEEWEAATASAEAAGIRVAHIRTGIALAPQGGVLARLAPLFKFGVGGRLGPGTQWMSWISLPDHIGAIRFLLDHDVRGAVNLTAPEPVTNREFTRALAAVLHRPAFLAVPKFGPKLLLGRELADLLLFVSQRVSPTVLLDAGYAFRHPQLEPALRAVLGKD
jgi:uncharacterized protein (TIGR01777 family)